MGSGESLDVDPRVLRLPPSRASGADPAKLQRQIAKHGKSTVGMPPLWVYRCADGELQINDGVTRATRIAKLLPGQTVPIEIVGTLSSRGAKHPTVEEKLP
jgi:hypothetical protein